MADQAGFRVSATSEFESYPQREACLVDLIATIRAPPAREGGRLPVSVGAVLDRSGSMSGKKIELVRATGKFMVRQLLGQDHLGVVAYDSKVTEPLPARPMDGAGKVVAANKISALRSGDYTNLSGGLFKGVQQQQEVAVDETPGPTRCVMLFTDGLANEGVTDPEKIVTTLSRMLEAKPDVKVHTLGFGTDHNEKMLQDIANAGQGVYYFIEREDDIPKAFADALGGLTSVMAQNAELSIAPASSDVFLEKVFSGFRVEDGPAGSKLVRFGDLCAEERKDVLVRLRIPKVDPTDKPFPLVTVKLTFMDVGEAMVKHVEMTLVVGRPEEVPLDRKPNPEVVDQRERIEAVEAMGRATREADNGNLDVALNLVMERRVALQAIPDLSSQAQDLLSDLREAERMFEDRKHYSSYGSKKVRNISHSHTYQRSSGPASAMRYATTSQMLMVAQSRMVNAGGGSGDRRAGNGDGGSPGGVVGGMSNLRLGDKTPGAEATQPPQQQQQQQQPEQPQQPQQLQGGNATTGDDQADDSNNSQYGTRGSYRT